MNSILQHLKQNWIKYGFESVAILVSIITAYGLNNWNEYRKEKVLEKQYVHGLIYDLQEDIKDQDRMLNLGKSTVESYLKVLTLFKETTEPDTSLMNIVANIRTFRPEHSNTVFEDIKFSGHVNTIKDDSIRLKIIDYYNTTAEKYEAMDLNLSIILDSFMNSIVHDDFNSILAFYEFPFGWVEVDPYKMPVRSHPRFQIIVNDYSVRLMITQLNMVHVTERQEHARQTWSALEKYLETL